MIKLGVVSIDVSHPLGFAGEMENNCMDMKYEYVCKESFRDDAEADWFVKRFNMAGKVDKVEDMVGKVDLALIQSCNWEKHLDQALPFIKAGKPVFIDKPIVGSVMDIKRLRDLVKNGAVIYGSSSVRYCEEIKKFISRPVEERGEILTMYCTCGVDEFNYGIHTIEAFSALAQSKIISGKYVNKAERNDGQKCETFNFTFENGITATANVVTGKWHPFHITIMTTTGSHYFMIDSSKIYWALLKEIYNQMAHGKSNLTDVETLINCTEAMLCVKKSREQKNGAEVKICELDDGDAFDGYAFEKEYGAKSVPIYK